MRKILLILGCVMVLGGCATTALPDAESAPVELGKLLAYQTVPPGDSGVITVKRDSGMLGSACRIDFYIDGILAGRIGTSEIAKFHVPAGERLIGISAKNNGLCPTIHLREQYVDVKSAAIRRFRISSNLNSGIALTPTSQ